MSRPGTRGSAPAGPGWHVECAAIATDHLGPAFDVHGGVDLVFPHHEMSASHTRVAFAGHPGHLFARNYAHAGMVGLDGEKMSKSLGNLVFVSRLTGAGEDPMAIRLALLAHHYREDWEWTDAGLAAARDRLARWRSAAAAALDGLAPHGTAPAVLAGIRGRLADDLDAPGALAIVDRWAASTLDGPPVGPPPARPPVLCLMARPAAACPARPRTAQTGTWSGTGWTPCSAWPSSGPKGPSKSYRQTFSHMLPTAENSAHKSWCPCGDAAQA